MLRGEREGEKECNIRRCKKSYNPETEKESIREKEGELEKSETSLVDMITLCAAAHPCVELVHSDNRVLWDTLFMLFIWLHIEKEAESCLNSIKKCNVVCILYLWVERQRGNLYCSKATSSSGFCAIIFFFYIVQFFFFQP